MKCRYLFMGLLLLVGCERREHKKDSLTAIPGKRSIAAGHKYFIVMGEGNATGQGMKTTPFPFDPYVLTRPPFSNNASPNLGPGFAFGHDYFFNERIPVDIIQCGVGGSSIVDWVAGGALHQACQAQWRGSNNPVPVSAILFLQGEQEGAGSDMRNAANWGQLFTNSVQQWRNSFNDPNMPVIVVQIGPNPAGYFETGNGVYTAWKTVQDQQEELFIPHVGVVKSKDLYSDWVYFDKTNCSLLGERMLVKYYELGGS